MPQMIVYHIKPEILGPSKGEACDECCDEPAEHNVRVGTNGNDTFWVKRWVFDLCGTCLAREEKKHRDDMKRKAIEESGDLQCSKD